MQKMVRFMVVSGLVFLSFPIGECADETKKTVLTMGRATDNVIKNQKQIAPVITYLASRLQDAGIERGEVVLAGDNKISTLVNFVKEGKLDIILDSPFPTTLLKIKANTIPILTIWRKGVGEYNSLIFIRRDSGIGRFEDLKGKIIAFEDPGSTSAYLLPKVSMKARGLDLVEVDSFDSPVPGGKIGYIFAGSEINISSWVYYNKVAAGALSNLDWSAPGCTPRAYKEELKVIYESQKIPEFIVSVRQGLDKGLVGRIKEELLNMDKSEEGREALKAYEFNKFVELPGGPEGVLKPIEDLVNTSGEEIR